MSNPTTAQPNPESAEIDTTSTATTPELTEPTTDMPERPEREAAKYRRQLRDVETERDNLTARVETLTRTLVEAALPKGMPAKGFWAVGPAPTDLLDEDGHVDQGALDSAVAQAETDLGINNLRTRVIVNGEGVIRDAAAPKSTPWADALRKPPSA